MDAELDNFSAARQVDFNSFADPRLSEKNRREFIFHEIEAAAHDTEKFRVLAETIPDSGRTFSVPEVEAVPEAFIAMQVKIPASVSRADAMSSVTWPKSMLGTMRAPEDSGLSVIFQTVEK